MKNIGWLIIPLRVLLVLVVLTMFVLRALLRQATVLQTDMEEVI